MIIKEIRQYLMENKDEGYGDFVLKLTPTLSREYIIGVRTPALRSYAKELIRREDLSDFLNGLPHKYYEENQLHSIILSSIKDYDTVLYRVDKFLPYVDNWATCDILSPNVFKKHTDNLIIHIDRWLKDKHTYTIRAGIGFLMKYYLGDNFDLSNAKKVAVIRSDEYYVNMMIAWYFATALAKNYNQVISFLENKSLDKWTHNKTIQKAIESFRVSKEHKEYLRSLRIK